MVVLWKRNSEEAIPEPVSPKGADLALSFLPRGALGPPFFPLSFALQPRCCNLPHLDDSQNVANCLLATKRGPLSAAPDSSDTHSLRILG